MTDPRVLMERDDATGIARITINNPERRNCYDPRDARASSATYLDELATDDGVKVVLLRGEGGVFSTGADMGNAYTWYDDRRRRRTARARRRRPSQRRRLVGRPQDVRLLPRAHGLPEGDGRRGARLRARRRARARAHGRHRGRGARHA